MVRKLLRSADIAEGAPTCSYMKLAHKKPTWSGIRQCLHMAFADGVRACVLCQANSHTVRCGAINCGTP